MINIQQQQRELDTLRHQFLEKGESVKALPDAERRAWFAPDGEGGAMKADIDSKFAALQSDAEFQRYSDQTRAEMKAANAPNFQGLLGGGGAPRHDARTVGQKFTESSAYLQRGGDTRIQPIQVDLSATSIKSWQVADEDSAIKATLTTSAGYSPFLTRTGRVVELGQIKPVIADFITQTQTDVPGGRYMEETTYTNAAAIVPEGTTKPEAALQFTERQFGMQKIAVNLPVTDEQLSDVPQIRGIIDNRLGLMVRQREDDYLLNNTTGGGGAFDGFLQKTGVQNVPLAGRPLATAVLYAMTQIEYDPGFAQVTALFMNPLDWAGYVTYQTTTGAYVVGSPDSSAITQMWGMPIVPTNRMPQGTALLGDFRTYAEILRREELTIRVGYINSDFVNNIQRILAEERMVLNIYRASAFAKVTGISF